MDGLGPPLSSVFVVKSRLSWVKLNIISNRKNGCMKGRGLDVEILVRLPETNRTKSKYLRVVKRETGEWDKQGLREWI